LNVNLQYDKISVRTVLIREPTHEVGYPFSARRSTSAELRGADGLSCCSRQRGEDDLTCEAPMGLADGDWPDAPVLLVKGEQRGTPEDGPDALESLATAEERHD